MNKKKIASAGVFMIFIAIGAGIAYYFYPAAINGALGINTAQIDDLTDDNSLSLLASTSAPMAAEGEEQSSASASDKKMAPKTAGATNAASPMNNGQDDTTATGADAGTGGVTTVTSTPVAIAAPCAFPVSAPASSTTRGIILNEIAWMGSPSSSTAEWMEIKNISSAPVALAGWELLDISGKIKISFGANDGTLAPGGLLVLARGSSTPSATVTVGKTYSGDLPNTGDVLALMDPQCNVSDYLDASAGWSAGNNTTKATLERAADGVGWQTSTLPGGTPGAENSMGVPATPSLAPASTSTSIVPVAPTATPTPQQQPPGEQQATSVATTSASSVASSAPAPAPDAATSSDSDVSAAAASSTSAPASPAATASQISSGHVLIAAVQIAGAASENDLVKLFNPTGSPIDMSGWKLHKKSSTGTDYSLKVFPVGSVIAPGGWFVWANSEDGFSTAVSADVSSTETLAADNSVALMDAAGTIVDAVAWGTGTSQYGEGPPYPTSPGANQLLSRRSSGSSGMADTGDNSSDFVLQ